MKNRLIALIAAGLAILGGTVSCFNSKIKPINVPAGEYRLSEEQLRSEGFSICSGVILDYGDGAIMAHVLPSFQSPRDSNYVNTRNVVSNLTRELESRGVNPKSCQAIVNAGMVESLYRIKQDLLDRGILVKESSLEEKGRNLTYDPKRNDLTISYIHN